MNKELYCEFDKASGEMLQLLSALNQAQLNAVPFEGSWTAAQVGEHLRKSYEVKNLLYHPVQPTHRAPDQWVEQIRTDFLNFSVKMQSPEFVVPEAIIYDKDALIGALKNSREQILQATETLDLSLTCPAFAFPVYGALTRLETIHFLICHTLRHNRQLKGISERL